MGEALKEHVVDVTTSTEGSEMFSVVGLSFADVEDDTDEGVPLAFCSASRQGLVPSASKIRRSDPVPSPCCRLQGPPRPVLP